MGVSQKSFQTNLIYSIFFVITDLVSPSSSSCAELSSPDQFDLRRNFPRGIINPNYPGFQHLAHTLTEHFVDHHQLEPLSDSEISEDFEYESYRAQNLDKMNDNNNNNGIAASDVVDKNKNSNISMNKNNKINNFYGDEAANVNLLLKSEPKVFCERKLLGLQEINLNEDDSLIGASNDNLSLMENVSSDEDEFEDGEYEGDEEDELEGHEGLAEKIDSEMVGGHFLENNLDNAKNIPEPIKMDYEEDDIGDSEDDQAIKIELENIDQPQSDQESINCNLETYLKSYENELKYYESEFNEVDCAKEIKITNCLQNKLEDQNKLPTPDILIEHSKNEDNRNDNKNILNHEQKIEIVGNGDGETVLNTTKITAVAPSTTAPLCLDECKNYQPDLIKNIQDSINTNDNSNTCEFVDNLTASEHECENSEQEENEEIDIEEKIINQCDSLLDLGSSKTNNKNEMIINWDTTTTDSTNHHNISFSEKNNLSLDSASSSVDIVGDFGKEIEKEIGLIVSGYSTSSTLSNRMLDDSPDNTDLIKSRHEQNVEKRSSMTKYDDESVFDENKFMEHLKFFSKVSKHNLTTCFSPAFMTEDFMFF